ncbi:sugar diacid utilization regulator [Noviherbaspirillum sp. Root189]|nr:sugar diacid utilization regulator [Noviherbaspirillum sp. Root189]
MKRSPPPKSSFVSGTLETYEEILRLLDQGEERHASLTSLLQEVEMLADDHPYRASLLGAAHRALTIGKRLEQHQQNELSLRAVFESAHALTELKELNQVLFDIVERGRRLLGSDLAWLSGVNPEDGNLCVLAVSGVHSNQALKTNPPVNAGVAGHVLRTRSPFATHDYMADTRFEHNPESDAMINGEALQSLVAVPLLSGPELTGILLVGDRYTRSYLPREISILATLAAHASVAVRNAQAFDLTRRALIDTEQANQRLKEQTAALELAADAHERLTKLLAKGASLKELIHSVANILDGRVTYLDAAGIEVCVATPPNYEAPEIIGSYQSVSGIDSNIQSAVGQSRVTGRAIAAQSATSLHCKVAAVMSGDELFGALVIQTQSPMTEQAVRVFERSATATAVLQLSAEKKSASLDQDINLTVRALLEPSQHTASDMLGQVARHGVDISKPLMLAVIDIEKTKVGYLVRKLSSRMRHRPQLSTEIDGHIVMVINQAENHLLEDELHALLFEELSFPGVAALSGPHFSLHGLAQSYPYVKRSIGLLHALRRKNCVVHESSLRMYAVLFQHQSAEELDATIESLIGRLTEYDAKRTTQLADTLHAYLDNMQNARVTAGVLQIHVNTLHNRLETIRTLLGSWDSDGRVAEIHLALRLRRLKNDARTVRV